MITIKYNDMVVTKEDGSFMNATTMNEGLYLKFADSVELIIPIPSNEVRTKLFQITQMLLTSSANNVVLDLNNRDMPVSFS